MTWRAITSWLNGLLGNLDPIQSNTQETVEGEMVIETTREWFGLITDRQVQPNRRLKAELAELTNRFHLKATKNPRRMVGRGKLIPHDVPFQYGRHNGRMIVLVGINYLGWEVGRRVEPNTGYQLIFGLEVRVLEPLEGQNPHLLCSAQIDLLFPPNYPQEKPEIRVTNIKSLGRVTSILNGDTICTLNGQGEWNPMTDDASRALDAFVGWIVNNHKRAY